MFVKFNPKLSSLQPLHRGLKVMLFQTLLAVLVVMGTLLSPRSAVAEIRYKALSGGMDHPMFSRFAGAKLVNMASERFASVKFPVGPYKDHDGKYAPPTETVEGKLSYYAYIAPKETTPIEVFRNYQNAMTKAGFKTLLSCESTEECQSSVDSGFMTDDDLLGPREKIWRDQSNLLPSRWFNTGFALLVAKMSKGEQVVYATLFVSKQEDYLENSFGYVLMVAEPSPMKADQVSVDADAIRKGLQHEGKVALYGLFFDTGKAEVKPESKPQLDEMGKLLSADKKVKVYIVGHTDNVGALESNLSLSQRRAQAVMDALAKGYGIETARMSARGVASLAPASSNLDEAGRARNRRVEMVAQ